MKGQGSKFFEIHSFFNMVYYHHELDTRISVKWVDSTHHIIVFRSQKNGA